MAAIDFDLTAVPLDLVASLPSGMTFACQNISTTATVFVRESAAVPGPSDRAFRIEAVGNFNVKNTGTPIWAWTDDPAGAAVIATESP